MKSVFIYISLLVFTICLTAHSVAVLADLKVKETKVANLFDMEEEEDTRDSDSETETENETEKEKEGSPEEKFFNGEDAALVSCFSNTNSLIHYCSLHFCVLDEISEQLTPPPRC